MVLTDEENFLTPAAPETPFLEGQPCQQPKGALLLDFFTDFGTS